jgi:hypothetical protein
MVDTAKAAVDAATEMTKDAANKAAEAAKSTTK